MDDNDLTEEDLFNNGRSSLALIYDFENLM